jgi:hypothetical protein
MGFVEMAVIVVQTFPEISILVLLNSFSSLKIFETLLDFSLQQVFALPHAIHLSILSYQMMTNDMIENYQLNDMN